MNIKGLLGYYYKFSDINGSLCTGILLCTYCYFNALVVLYQTVIYYCYIYTSFYGFNNK